MATLFDNTAAPKAARATAHAPRMNDDGISVKGCSIIYPPRGQAGEYAPLAINLFRGCGHGCAYCYVPAVIKMDRGEFDAGSELRPGIMEKLRNEAAKYDALDARSQIMFSFSTDPYPPAHHIETREAIQILRAHRLPFCTLTKGGSRALRDIDLFNPETDAFASTLTTLDDKFSKKWERGAQLPGDRIATLKAFHDAGVFTWVSLEPTLDVEASLAIVEATQGFVDLFKVGQANYLKEITRTTDWRDYTHRMIARLAKLGVAAYIKKDLQPYLPAGYPNPLRVAQNNAPASRAALAELAIAQHVVVADVYPAL